MIETVPLPLPDPVDAETRAALSRARVEPEAFAQEQAFHGPCWTFLGLARDIPHRNDWFTATLGGKPIFVQRFEQGIFGFLNRCAHRGYPLRVGERGNGAVVCGFHHWRYNHEGLALGIPACPEMFGKTPREMDARLPPVEIGQVGDFLFGRFVPEGGGPGLEQWLGPMVPILGQVNRWLDRPAGALSCDVKANWRSLVEISFDDYHLVAIHPSTFGKGGYLPVEGVHYERFGAHSAYFRGGDGESLARMLAACEAGTYLPDRYRIFQIYPGFLISFVKALDYLGEGYWYVIVQDVRADAPDRSRTRLRFFRLPHAPATSTLRRFLRWLAWPTVNVLFRFFARRVHAEDNLACESLQRVLAADDPAPRLARHEERIGWFEQSWGALRRGHFPLP